MRAFCLPLVFAALALLYGFYSCHQILDFYLIGFDGITSDISVIFTAPLYAALFCLFYQSAAFRLFNRVVKFSTYKECIFQIAFQITNTFTLLITGWLIAWKKSAELVTQSKLVSIESMDIMLIYITSSALSFALFITIRKRMAD
ncbi:hypothetical protein ACIP6T_17210 [Pantoea sp. NPDC088449]|uniref:hypothetical protein n=1 Tax=Pantoea sp. NPDC088449 TaxID=3364392 RepID=UPI00380258A5